MTAQTILPANSVVDTGYNVDNSLRFNDGSSDYLSRTPDNAGNQKLFTYSVWIKRSTLGSNQNIFHEYPGSGQRSDIIFRSTDAIRVSLEKGNSNQLLTNRIFRDPSAWYHIVVVYDSDNSTEGNRVKLYVNGVRETSFATEQYPNSGSLSGINTTGEFEISSYDGDGDYFNGYMAENVLIDGQALDPTSFGEFDSDSGIWKPIDVSGLTFGTNGFYLQYKESGTSQNSSGLGADTSGNDHHFAVNNLTAVDQTVDTCTNNFATMNPLYKNTVVLSEGNLLAVEDSSEFDSVLSTIAVSSGKWYVEFKVIALAGSIMRNYFGICDVRDETPFSIGSIGADESGRVGDTVAIEKAAVNKNGSSEYSITNNAANDIFGVSLDLDNGAVYFSKNGSLLNSGNPASGASKTGAVAITTGQTYLFGMTAYDSSCSANFGNPHVALSSANADANGYGSFEYAVPSGYYSLNTKNLAEYG